MNRPLTPLPALDSRPQLNAGTRPRARRQRLELELAHDLAVLAQAGLIKPVVSVAGASDETLRFSLTEIGHATAAGIAMPPAAKEHHGSRGIEPGR